MKKLLISAIMLLSFVAVTAYAVRVPDTGQTGDWTTIWGEDSDYTINPHSYTDLGNGIVRDNVTDLEWVQDGNLMATRDPGFDNDTTPGDGKVTWQHAFDYVANLNNENYLGYSDWRLPNVKELATLMDSGAPYYTSAPQIDPRYFPDTVDDFYWTSTTDSSKTGEAWCGSPGPYPYCDKSSCYYVRAVRGRLWESGKQLFDNGDGTVSDIATGLMWQQSTAPGDYSWEEALLYCEGLELAGYSDWRLPNHNELLSIVDYDTHHPAIDTTYFPGTEDQYWTSTPWGFLVYYTYINHVDFDDGRLGVEAETSDLYVRAVRGGGLCEFLGDSDLDGICDDGDVSGVPGDNPCMGGNSVFCDDNCPDIANPNQEDADNDGTGDFCDNDTIYGTISGAVQGGISIDIYVYSCGLPTTVVTITTNDEGYYAVGGLANDSYGIIPYYSNYAFSPRTRILRVPQTNIRSYDFTASLLLLDLDGDGKENYLSGCSNLDGNCDFDDSQYDGNVINVIQDDGTTEELKTYADIDFNAVTPAFHPTRDQTFDYCSNLTWAGNSDWEPLDEHDIWKLASANYTFDTNCGSYNWGCSIFSNSWDPDPKSPWNPPPEPWLSKLNLDELYNNNWYRNWRLIGCNGREISEDCTYWFNVKESDMYNQYKFETDSRWPDAQPMVICKSTM